MRNTWATAPHRCACHGERAQLSTTLLHQACLNPRMSPKCVRRRKPFSNPSDSRGNNRRQGKHRSEEPHCGMESIRPLALRAARPAQVHHHHRQEAREPPASGGRCKPNCERCCRFSLAMVHSNAPAKHLAARMRCAVAPSAMHMRATTPLPRTSYGTNGRRRSCGGTTRIPTHQDREDTHLAISSRGAPSEMSEAWAVGTNWYRCNTGWRGQTPADLLMVRNLDYDRGAQYNMARRRHRHADDRLSVRTKPI